MSRRKQSNPKPLKWEENWNESEEGRKSVVDSEKADNKDAVDGSPNTHQNIHPEDEAMKSGNESGDESESQKVVKPTRESPDKSLLVKSASPETDSENDGTIKLKMGSSESRELKGKFRHPSMNSSSAPVDGREHSSPSYNPTAERQKNPLPMDSSNPLPTTFSHEQLIQAGLPYLHLLPAAIRNDAARFFFMPPNVSPELTAASVAMGSDGSQSQHKSKKVLPDPTIARTGPAYMCEPCNIKFSSSRTLEAHQTYYCSFRKETEKEQVETKSESGDGELKNENRDTASVGGRKRERESSGEEHELSIDESPNAGTECISINPTGSGGSNQTSDSTAGNKNVKTGKLYSCSYCSYSADKKVSLNRHMRMHSGGPPSIPNGNLNGESRTSPSFSGQPPVTPGRGVGEGVTSADRYCFDCEIQFSSLKTFKVHKQYYCSTRHVMKTQLSLAPPTPGLKAGGSEISINSSAPSPHGSVTPGIKHSGAGSPATPEGSPVPIGSPIPSQPFVVLPTNPVIVVPYCFIQGASVVPGNMLPSHNSLIILPNGSVHSLPGTTMPMPISMSFPSPSHPLGSLIMGAYGHPDLSPGSTTIPNNLSPPGQHSVFNDPKDVIRRICGGTRNSSASGDTTGSPDSHAVNSRLSHRSSVSEKDGNESMADMEVSERNGEESVPAIDLTLRNFIKKEVAEEEDEKENHDVGHRDRMGTQAPSFVPQPSVGSSQTRNDIICQTDAELRNELSVNSPSRQSLSSTGSTQSERRTPRPPSISSSCSSSPAPIYADQKQNGLKLIRPSSGLNSHSLMPTHAETYPNGSKPVVKTKSDLGILANKLRSSGSTIDKMNPIATQLPGGAILTTTSNQSLAELLMPNPPELTESLAKLNSHHVMSSGSPEIPPFEPGSMMAAAAALPAELAMNYLASIQHSLQQHHQHQLQAAKHAQQPQQSVGMKRGVWKCVECEIVFYKQENFVVHKEQYCASRINANTKEGKGMTRESSIHQRGYKSKENQISKPEPIVSRSSSSTGEVSISPPLLTRSGPIASSIEMNSLSTTCLRKSPNAFSTIETKAPFESEGQFKIKSESPVSTPSPAIGSPARSTPNQNHMKAETSSSSFQVAPSSPYSCQKCGVKYSSLDNLTTHQTFYCNKRPLGTSSFTQESTNCSNHSSHNSNVPQTKPTTPNPVIGKLLAQPIEKNGFVKCGRCNLSIPEEQMNLHRPVCPGQTICTTSGTTPTSSVTSGWKCPCCDTYSPTMSAAQKHLETHTGIRAFKCVICGYRGNTLRGMRTHIRMHFDKRSSDLQEGEYISCITATDMESGGQPEPNQGALSSAGSVNGALAKRRGRVTLVG